MSCALICERSISFSSYFCVCAQLNNERVSKLSEVICADLVMIMALGPCAAPKNTFEFGACLLKLLTDSSNSSMAPSPSARYQRAVRQALTDWHHHHEPPETQLYVKQLKWQCIPTMFVNKNTTCAKDTLQLTKMGFEDTGMGHLFTWFWGCFGGGDMDLIFNSANQQSSK